MESKFKGSADLVRPQVAAQHKNSLKEDKSQDIDRNQGTGGQALHQHETPRGATVPILHCVSCG